MLLEYYLNKLGLKEIPSFLIPYLECPSLKRLKQIGYFCGMDYASKDIYDFKELITRYDHSLSTALLTYRLTKDKIATIAALFHDIATPCFSHVIDYMNKDYARQESTEKYTRKIILEDEELLSLLRRDGIPIDSIINFKQFSVVDNERPKLCADRLDGIILNGIGCTKNINADDIDDIIDDITLFINEDGEYEIGFKTESIARRVLEVNDSINEYFHSNEDNYMMELLANITKKAINKGIITEEQLYILSEKDILSLIEFSFDSELREQLHLFKTIKREDIPKIRVDNIKERSINPLVGNTRIIRDKFSLSLQLSNNS